MLQSKNAALLKSCAQYVQELAETISLSELSALTCSTPWILSRAPLLRTAPYYAAARFFFICL